MSLIEKILLFLQTKMNEPSAFGMFHLAWITIMCILIFLLFKIRNRHSEKQLKIILGVYAIIAFILELLKQISWSFNYDNLLGVGTWEYTWYSAPFQLCTTPVYVCLIALFLKKCSFRDRILSYVAFITIWGSFMTILLPDSCLIEEILINVHTMWLHLGSFVVSLYLLFSKEILLEKKNIVGAIKTFVSFVLIALLLNVSIYNSGILNGDTFDMFYISPYFEKDLPVFSELFDVLPYYFYLPLYVIIISFGGYFVYRFSRFVEKGKFFKKIKK